MRLCCCCSSKTNEYHPDRARCLDGAHTPSASATALKAAASPTTLMVPAPVPLPTDGFLESEQAFTRYITGSDGKLRLCMYLWPAKEGVPVKGVVQLTHGHGCYIPHGFLLVPVPGKAPVYEGSWVEAMNAAGWSVFGMDLRGAGRSSGLRCYCDSFDEYLEDSILAARRCREADVPGFEKSLPMFVMGHSMGGCLAVMMALREKDLYTGVVLMAPMLSLEKVSNKGINRYLKPLASMANALVPKAAIVQVNKNVMYPDIQEAYDKDPLNHTSNTRVRNASEYLRVTSWIMANADQVTFPYLIFHSENDTMCDCDGSKQLYEKSKSKDKELKFINHMWHIICKEPGNEKVLADILDWMDARL